MLGCTLGHLTAAGRGNNTDDMYIQRHCNLARSHNLPYSAQSAEGSAYSIEGVLRKTKRGVRHMYVAARPLYDTSTD